MQPKKKCSHIGKYPIGAIKYSQQEKNELRYTLYFVLFCVLLCFVPDMNPDNIPIKSDCKANSDTLKLNVGNVSNHQLKR